MSKRNSGHTGPTSPEGKANSSENSTTHGCCSSKLLVKGEKQEDLDALRNWWMREVKPPCFSIILMVEEVVRANWLLERNRRNEALIQQQLADKDPREWDKADHDRLQLFTRYVKAAENSFHRAVRAVREAQKHDAYLRDREEQRALDLVKDMENELKRVRKIHPHVDYRPHERGLQEFRESIAKKFAPLDDYLPGERQDQSRGPKTWMDYTTINS
jgi:hypothetical protein